MHRLHFVHYVFVFVLVYLCLYQFEKYLNLKLCLCAALILCIYIHAHVILFISYIFRLDTHENYFINISLTYQKSVSLCNLTLSVLQIQGTRVFSANDSQEYLLLICQNAPVYLDPIVELQIHQRKIYFT